MAGTIPVLAQRAAWESPRWTRAVRIIPATPYKVVSDRSLRRLMLNCRLGRLR